jgi:seryl-tRNA synthetase
VIAALLENGYENGIVTIPKVLRSYTGFDQIG